MILTQYPSTQDAIPAVETNLIAFVAFTAELQFFSRAAGCPTHSRFLRMSRRGGRLSSLNFSTGRRSISRGHS
jgi:hypothetical protein